LRNRLIAYVDSDHATDPDDRKSTSGYVIFCNSGPIAWASSKQKSTSSSTAESEFKAMHKVSQEVMFLRQLIQVLGYGDSLEPSDILEDNVACEQYVRNPVLHGRMKHIDIAYHVVKDWHETIDPSSWSLSVAPGVRDDSATIMMLGSAAAGLMFLRRRFESPR
jgi:hypothetical protein